MILAFAEQRFGVRQGKCIGLEKAGELPPWRDSNMSLRLLVDLKLISGGFIGSETEDIEQNAMPQHSAKVQKSKQQSISLDN